jgi:diguanylate cyclase (GGDEF)-like protein
MVGGLIVRVLGGLAALLAVCAALPASAALGRPLATCVRPVLPGQTARAMFADPRGFDCSTPQHRLGAGDYWVLSQPLPRVSGDVHVRSASVWQDRTTLHILYADGAIRSAGFTRATAWRHLALGAMFQLPVPQRAAPPVRLLWRVDGAMNLRGVVLAPAIVGHRTMARNELLMAALYGGFAGLCLALLLYNLALYGALRQAFLPVYCLLVLSLAAYAFSASGLLGQVTGMDNNMRQRCNWVLLALSAGAAIAFARSFFERRVFDGWLRPASTAVVAFLLAVVALFTAAVPAWAVPLDRLVTLGYVLAVGLVVPVLWRAWRTGSRYTGLFALAWGAPVVLASCRILNSLNLIPWNFWVDNSTLLAMALEAALSALAIAYRIRLLSEERDAAREQEMRARLLADSDPLTGLLNRRAFLREALAQPGERLLVLVDIDHFKAVNDTLGHDGGDEVLRRIARVLRRIAPAQAAVARLGGEEFALLCAGGEAALPEAVLAAIRAERMPFDLAVTASVGSERGVLASEADWARLYRRADQALYAAKRAGRDRARSAAQVEAA